MGRYKYNFRIMKDLDQKLEPILKGDTLKKVRQVMRRIDTQENERVNYEIAEEKIKIQDYMNDDNREYYFDSAMKKYLNI